MRKILRTKQLLPGVLFSLILFIYYPSFAQGGLDPDFGSGGSVITFFGQGETNDTYYKMALQPDGKIIIASAGKNDNGYALLARYNTDGTPDESFGTGGKVETLVYNQNQGIFLYDMVLSPGGEIFITGRGIFGSNHEGCERFIIKYLSNGSPDSGFDTDGKLLFTTQTDLTDDCITNAGIGLLSDGRIVLASYFNVPDRTELEIRNTSGALLDRLNNVEMEVKGLKVLPSDEILLYGYYLGDFKLAKYNTDLFLAGNPAVVDFGGTDIPTSLAWNPQDERIVIAGNSANNFAVACLTSEAVLDNSFSDDGKLLLAMGNIGNANDVAIQQDGKIVVIGSFHVNGTYGWAIARLLTDGSPDPCFGQDGWLTYQNDIENNYGNSVAIQSDGKILIAGKRSDGSAPASFVLARYIPGTSAIYYFDADGDGYGDKNDQGESSCSPVAGKVTNNDDCDDANPAVHPGATETCNSIDDDCDGQIDEGCPTTPTVTINNITVNEAAGTANLTLSIFPVANVPVKVTYKTVDGSAQSKTKNKDFKAVGNGNITIAAGAGSATISIDIVADNISEADEQFSVQLTKVTGAQIGAPSTAIVTITESNANPATTKTSNTQIESESKSVNAVKELTATVYPNPASNYFNILLNSNDSKERITMQVTDMYGRVIEARDITVNSTIKLGDRYRPGTYFVRVMQGKQHKEIKLVKLPD